MPPLILNVVDVGTRFWIGELNAVVNLQMSIALLPKCVIWLPTVRVDDRARFNPLLDDW